MGSTHPSSPAAASRCHGNQGWGPLARHTSQQVPPAPTLPRGEAPVPALETLKRNGTFGSLPTVAASERWEPGAGCVGNRARRPALTPFPSLPQPSAAHKNSLLEFRGEQQVPSTNFFLLKPHTSLQSCKPRTACAQTTAPRSQGLLQGRHRRGTGQQRSKSPGAPPQQQQQPAIRPGLQAASFINSTRRALVFRAGQGSGKHSVLCNQSSSDSNGHLSTGKITWRAQATPPTT